MPFERLEKMTHRQLMKYYDLYLTQRAEEEVITEIQHPELRENKKKLPHPKIIQAKVEERMKEYKKTN